MLPPVFLTIMGQNKFYESFIPYPANSHFKFKQKA